MADTTATDSLGAWALAYARRGIPVLPLAGKLPRIPKRLGGRGVHDATCDLEQVRAWWRRWPQANIGVRCGVRFDVIDVDREQGRRSLEQFLAEHDQPPIGGPRVRTGAGGWHLYVTPTGLPDRIGVLDHVDYRAADRYVVAPPSRHPATRRRYRWVVGCGIDTPLGQVPAALGELLVPRRIEQPPRPTVRPLEPGHPYGQRALVAEAAAVATAPRGRRNQQLWRSARSLYRLVAGGVLDEGEVTRALGDAAAQCGLLAEEPRATQRTLQSAREVGMSQPRGIPVSGGRRLPGTGPGIAPPGPDEPPLGRK
jgi:Bifunctional DNA primase/polymerase, N-terminal